MDLAFTPETAARVKITRHQGASRIVLAPGRDQLRFGVRESAGGENGTAFYDLTCPISVCAWDFEGGRVRGAPLRVAKSTWLRLP